MSIHNLCTKADEIKDFSNVFCPVTTPVFQAKVSGHDLCIKAYKPKIIQMYSVQ